MAATVATDPGIKTFGRSASITASAQSDWFVINGDAKTANTAGLLRPSALTTSTSLNRVAVPEGATRLLIRGRTDVGADLFTTPPVVVIVGEDANGVYTRLDNVDSNATGVTVTFQASTAVFSNGTVAGTNKMWTDPTSLDGYDVKGSKYVWCLIATAAALTDGGAAVEAEIMGLFLN